MHVEQHELLSCFVGMEAEDEMLGGESTMNEVGPKEEIVTGEITAVVSEPKKATVQTAEINNQQSEMTSVKGSVAQSPKKQTQEKYHKLWLPDKPPRLADLVLTLRSSREQQTKEEATTPLQELESQSKSSLKLRQQLLNERIQVTQAVLPDKIYKTKAKKMTFNEAAKMVIARQRSNLKVSDDVSDYLAKMKAKDVTAPDRRVSEAVTPSYTIANLVSGMRRKYDTQLSSDESLRRGSIPLSRWREIVKKNMDSFDSIGDGTEDSS